MRARSPRPDGSRSQTGLLGSSHRAVSAGTKFVAGIGMHPDDTTLDTLDTSIDTAALDDATELEEALDTEQIPALDPQDLDLTALNPIGTEDRHQGWI